MMARLPAMVTALARIDGRDRGTVDNLIRYIRERGYIPTGKRGHGAAEMTTREVVNGLLALNGADGPKDAPVAIDRFRSLRNWFAGTTKDFRARDEGYDSFPKAIQAVMDSGTFGEALEALIDEMPSLVASLKQYTTDAYTQFTPEQVQRAFPGFLTLHVLGVDVILQRYAATIELYVTVGSERRVEFQAKFIQDDDRFMDGFYGNASATDRRVSVTIGTPTLIAAWQVLHPHEFMPELPIPTPDDSTEDDET